MESLTHIIEANQVADSRLSDLIDETAKNLIGLTVSFDSLMRDAFRQASALTNNLEQFAISVRTKFKTLAQQMGIGHQTACNRISDALYVIKNGGNVADVSSIQLAATQMRKQAKAQATVAPAAPAYQVKAAAELEVMRHIDALRKLCTPAELSMTDIINLVASSHGYEVTSVEAVELKEEAAPALLAA